jgi:hypothetical protein
MRHRTRTSAGLLAAACTAPAGLSPLARCIGFVQQAAALQVGEKGTVGAATGEPLFLAKVGNPTAS